MNDIIRSFGNHLGIETENKFLERYQVTVALLASIVGDFSYEKAAQNIFYRWHSWFDSESFERGGQLIHEKEYLINSNEFVSYRSDNSAIFDTLEAKATEIYKKSLLGNLATENLPIDSLQIQSIFVSPSTETLRFKFIDAQNYPIEFFRQGADYHAIIDVNGTLVYQVVELAKARSIQADNFFNL